MSVPDIDALCEAALARVYHRAWALLPAEAVDDVVQETMLAAARNFRHWRQEAAFQTWLMAILRCRVADYYRGRARQVETVGDGAIDTVPLMNDYTNGLLIRLTLAALHPSDQEILLLRFAEGFKFREIAGQMGISLEATKSRYRRAVGRFREAWDA